MGHDEVWKTLADLITEFRRRGESIPSNVMEDLRAAKTMIEVLRADPSRIENVPSIELYLGNVESYLIFEAQKKFGSEFVDEWMQKIKEARQTKAPEEHVKPSSKFVPGLPRGQKWVRVQVSKETPEREIKKLAEDTGLSFKMQRDGYMLVYGDDEKLKLFVKKAAEKLRSRKAQ
jgi:hypothetical protein